MRHKPDAVWQRPESSGGTRTTILLEVDLGHYSRQRLLGKLDAFQANPRAEMIIVAPTLERVGQIDRWLQSDRRFNYQHARRPYVVEIARLVSDCEYLADRYGSHPVHHPDDEIHWQRKTA